MTETTLSSIGLAYRWILSYYADVAKFCRRVRGELGERGYVQYSSTDSIEAPLSRSLGLTQNWLPCYHYQLFRTQVSDTTSLENERVALLCVGIDHFDPAAPDRAEPIVYLARFGPVLSNELGELKSGIVSKWNVEETDAPTWREGTFRRSPYTYRTLPLSAIATLDDVVPKIVAPLIEHDRARSI